MPHDRLSAGFKLGDWLVKPEDGSLSAGNRTTRLEPLVMSLLVFLCQRAGRVVTKDEILEGVWQGRFVSDDTVKASFYQLRKALGDSPRQPRFVETLPKRGYRVLVEPVLLERPADGAAPRSTADEIYRKGTALLEGHPAPAALKQARLYFERAIEADPDHAESAAALAHTYVHLIAAGLASGAELLPRARTLAARALELSPGLASGHVALGVARLLYGRDGAGAEQGFRRAIALDPDDAAAHRWYGRLLSFTGRHAGAVAEARLALGADPLSLAARRDLLEALFLGRLYDDAVAEAQHLVRMAGHAPDVQLGLAWLYYLAGDEPRAFEAVRAGFRALGAAPEVLDRAARAFERGGMRAVLELWAELLAAQAALGLRTIDLIFLYALLGEKDRAFQAIDAVVEDCHPALLMIPVSPLLDGLRSDPRYAPLVSRLMTPIPR